MRKKGKRDESFNAGWKKLAPKSYRKPVSVAAFRKRVQAFVRILALCLVLGLASWSVWWWEKKGKSSFEENSFEFTGPGVQIDEISFKSDGVLTKRWFCNWLGPLRSRSLMQLDIFKVRSELEKEPQIVSAVVKRVFPSSLIVELREHQPILVLRLGGKTGGFEDWMVSGDGSLYQGTDYPRAMLSLLPSLSIDSNLLRYNDEGNGFQKLKGIPTISPLLNLARRNYPHLYEDWQVLSYENPSGEDFGSSIRIRSGKVRSLTFQPSNFNVQLKRLSYLLSEPDFRKKPVVESIDLSFGRSVFAKL